MNRSAETPLLDALCLLAALAAFILIVLPGAFWLVPQLLADAPVSR